jgi:histidine triad (HIT) family protein
MTLSDEQAKTIKEQLFKQIESFPEDKRQEIKQYISGLNNEQLEEFLIKNKLMQPQGSAGEQEDSDSASKPSVGPAGQKGEQCVYCMLANKQIESLAIYEDKDYLAVLEINPISLGHTVLIPKKHLTETKLLHSKAFTIANKIGKHLVKKLKAENFQITSSDELKHALINIILRYKGQPVTFERKPAKKPELQETAMKIGKLEKAAKKPVTKKQDSKKDDASKGSSVIKFPRRIP